MKLSILIATTLSATEAVHLQSSMPFDQNISNALGLDGIVPAHPIAPPENMDVMSEIDESAKSEGMTSTSTKT